MVNARPFWESKPKVQTQHKMSRWPFNTGMRKTVSTGLKPGVCLWISLAAGLAAWFGLARCRAASADTGESGPPQSASGSPLIRLLSPAAAADRQVRMQWWREARFGLFINWGLYALPAGQWNGQPVRGTGEWIMNWARIPAAEYAALAGRFQPARFDAAAWAALAVESGARYLVFTAKHHDGFAMYRSQVSGFNVVDATPFKRDPAAELAQACQKLGLKFGLAYSHAMDWHETNGAGNVWDFPPDDKKNFDEFLNRKTIPQLRELLANYQPAVLWFNTPRMITPVRAEAIRSLVRTNLPGCIINSRIGDSSGDYISTPENRVPNAVFKTDWECPVSMNHTWGFRSDDTDWKKPADLVFKLVDTVSKGGNLLVNVGPDANGEIPAACQQSLRQLGQWLKINGEAIYGAGPTPFGDELILRSGKITRDLKDWRCTSKPQRLYIHLFTRPPKNIFTLPLGKIQVKAARMLADPQGEKLAVNRVEDATFVTLPQSPGRLEPQVLVLDLESPPQR